MTSWVYEAVKGAVEQVYEFMNNEESFSDTISEIVCTMQTGYPRYIISNFSIEDLEKFLGLPHIDTFFIVVMLDGEDLEYGLVYKSQFRSGIDQKEWRISHSVDNSYVSSVPLRQFITGKSLKREESGYSSEECYGTFIEDEEDSEEMGIIVPPEVEKKILLLRPKTGSFSNNKIRKLISIYESKGKFSIELSSENYIFQYLLGQPEYLDVHKFKIIREMFFRVLTSSDDATESAKICRHINTLFDDGFRAYQIGLLM